MLVRVACMCFIYMCVGSLSSYVSSYPFVFHIISMLFIMLSYDPYSSYCVCGCCVCAYCVCVGVVSARKALTSSLARWQRTYKNILAAALGYPVQIVISWRCSRALAHELMQW